MKPTEYDIPLYWRIKSITNQLRMSMMVYLTTIIVFVIWIAWLWLNGRGTSTLLYLLAPLIVSSIGIYLYEIYFNPRRGDVFYEIDGFKVHILDMDYFVPPDVLRGKLQEHVIEPLSEYISDPIPPNQPIEINILGTEKGCNTYDAVNSNSSPLVVCSGKHMLEEKMYEDIRLEVINQMYPYKITSTGNSQLNKNWLKKRGLMRDKR